MISILLGLVAAPACEAKEEAVPPLKTAGDTPPPPEEVEKFVAQRLETIGNNAGPAEHGFNSTTITFEFEGNEIFVFVPQPGKKPLPGKESRREHFDGVTATAVETEGSFGRVWEFNCDLDRLGNRRIAIAFARNSAKTVRAVYDALGCGS
jgi:hypothetical protein